MSRRKLSIGGLALLLIAAPLMLVHWCAYTEDGLQFIARHVPRRIGRTEMELQGARGTLAKGFTVERFELEHPRVHLRVLGARGRLALLPLLWQTIDGRDMHARELSIQIRHRDEPDDHHPLRFLPIPLIIRTENAQLDSGVLIAPNGRRFDTSNLKTSGVLRQYTLKLFDSAFRYEVMQVAGDASLIAADPLKIAGSAHIVMSFPQQPVWTMNASSEGNLDTLAVRVQIATPFRADFAGQALDLTGRWHWLGNAQVHDFDLAAWGAGGALGRIAGTLRVHGDAQGFGGEGPLTPSGLKAGLFQALFQGSYADRVVTADRISLRHGSGAVIQAHGAIAVADGGPRLDLRGDWRDFRWPLIGRTPALKSSAGNFELSGIWPYDWQATGDLVIPALPQAIGTFAGQGRLSKDRVFLDDVTLDAFDGHIDTHGEAQWSPLPRWAAAGRAQGMNIAKWRPDLPGRLNFGFDVNGTAFDAQSDFELALEDLSGQLRGVRAQGAGSISRHKDGWTFDNLRMVLGGTRLAASGSLTRDWDLRFSLDTEDLALLAPDSRGHLHAMGTLRGSLAEPTVTADLRATAIQHAGMTLESLEGSVDFDALNRHPSKIDLRARKLVYDGRALDGLEFTLNGMAASHEAHLNARAGTLILDAHANGSFAHGLWNGQLRALNLDDRDLLNLSLDAPFAAVLGAEHAGVARFCLHGTPGHLCAVGDWTPRAWNAGFEANDLPLGSLTADLTPGVQYRGSLAITAHAQGGGGQPLQGDLKADLVDARMLHRLASGKLQSILLGSGRVVANAMPASVDAQIDLSAGIGTISGHATLQRPGDSWADYPLTGTLRVETAELGFVTLYAPQIDRAAGKLLASLSFAGTAGAPLVDGEVKLSNAELDLYQINFALRGAEIDAMLKSNSLDFKGTAKVGAGAVATHGNLLWRDSLPYGELHLDGTNLRVVDVPEAKIDASPNLDFKLTGRRIEVAGSVAVPYAKIEPRDLRNAVRASSDEVLIGAAAAPPGKPLEVLSTVTLSLGDKVDIDTTGLTARLKGNLTVKSGYDPITHGTGELSVEEGKYTAYGRKLDIERGRLIFSGGPVEDPGLDIRATKQFPDVVAGVNVRGTLLAPRTTFFSDPTLPQSQIVSLILAGGSLGSVQTQSQAQNKQTGNELLAQGGAIIAQQLGSRVGIEDVSLEQDLSNETSLVLGKYLSPRLYVSYGISLAEAINTLKLRYSLNDRWTIKSEMGQARGADLVYTIEK